MANKIQKNIEAGRDFIGGDQINKFYGDVNIIVDNPVIKPLLKELSKLIDDKKLPNHSQYISIYEIIKDKVEIDLKNYKLKNAFKDLESIINSKVFSSDNIINSQLLILMGDIALKLGNSSLAKDIYDQLTELNISTTEFSNFKVKLSESIKDELLYQQSLDELKINFHYSEQELYIIELEHLLKKNSNIEIIHIITDNNLITKYKDDSRFNYYLGFAYLQIGDYNNAEIFLFRSYQIKPIEWTLYLLSISKANPILLKKKLNLNSNEIKILNKVQVNLLDIEHFFVDRLTAILEEYWNRRLYINLFINPNNVINDITNIPDSIKNNNLILYPIAEAYFYSEQYEEALKYYEKIYSTQMESTTFIKILLIMTFFKKYDQAIDRISKLTEQQFDEEGQIIGLWLLSIYKTKGFEVAQDMYNKHKDNITRSYHILISYIDILIQEKKFDTIQMNINIINNTIPRNNDFRYILSQVLYNFKLFDEAVLLLEYYENKNDEAEELLLHLYTISNKSDNYAKFNEFISNKDLKEKDNNYLNCVANFYMKIGDLDKAYDLLDISFSNQEDVVVSYNLINAAVRINKQTQIKSEVIDYLIRIANNNSHSCIALAIYYKSIGNKGLSDNYAYKSLAYLRNNFDKNIFEIYIQLYMLEASQNKIINFDHVELNTVIKLQAKNGDIKLICLDSELDLFSSEPLEFIDVEHYSKNNQLSLKLLNKKLNDVVTINNIDYTISEIINKHTFSIRYCINQITQSGMEDTIIKAFTIDENNPLQDIIHILYEGKTRSDLLLKQYNNIELFGLPLYSLAEKNSSRYLDTILFLLQNKNTIFYAGEIQDIDIDNCKYAISLSSLIILKTFNCLNLLNNFIDHIYIAPSVITFIERMIQDIISNYHAEKGTAGISDEGTLIYRESTEEEKMKLKDFWIDLLDISKKFKTQDVELNANYYVNDYISLFGKFEIETIQMAIELDAVLISDDLCSRKIFHGINKKICKSTNSVIFVNSIIEKDLPYALDLLVTVSKVNYLYCINESYLCLLINTIISKPILLGIGTNIDKFNILVHNITRNPVIFSSYSAILRNLIKFFIEKTIITSAIEEILKILIINMKNFWNKSSNDDKKYFNIILSLAKIMRNLTN